MKKTLFIFVIFAVSCRSPHSPDIEPIQEPPIQEPIQEEPVQEEPIDEPPIIEEQPIIEEPIGRRMNLVHRSNGNRFQFYSSNTYTFFKNAYYNEGSYIMTETDIYFSVSLGINAGNEGHIVFETTPECDFDFVLNDIKDKDFNNSDTDFIFTVIEGEAFTDCDLIGEYYISFW
jgi:hypothetical protein